MSITLLITRYIILGCFYNKSLNPNLFFFVSGGRFFRLLRLTLYVHHSNAGEHTGGASPWLEGALPGALGQRPDGFHDAVRTGHADHAWSWNARVRRLIVSRPLARTPAHAGRGTSPAGTLRTDVRTARIRRKPGRKFRFINARPVRHAPGHVWPAPHVRPAHEHGPRAAAKLCDPEPLRTHASEQFPPAAAVQRSWSRMWTVCAKFSVKLWPTSP